MTVLTGERLETVTARAYRIPTDRPEADGTAQWDATTMVVVQVGCAGQVGTGWTYGSAACAVVVRELLAPVLAGQDALSVPACWLAMVRAVRNATRAGAVGYALSAADVALWDLKARLLGRPLADLLGRAHDAVPVYGSGGFTNYPDEVLVEQLSDWTGRQGIPRVKLKIGQDRGGDTDRDLDRIRRARTAIGESPELYVDANGAYQVKQAVRLARRADAEGLGVTWFEEPVSSDDLAGLRAVREQVDADVAAGEYGTDLTYFRRMCAAGAVDCLQVDATRAGGCTEWLRAAAVADAYHLQVSGHCAPHLHAHLAAATPNLRHLEWFHDHVRIENLVFSGTLDPTGGRIRPDRHAPGHGLTFEPEAAAPYAIQP